MKIFGVGVERGRFIVLLSYSLKASSLYFWTKSNGPIYSLVTLEKRNTHERLLSGSGGRNIPCLSTQEPLPSVSVPKEVSNPLFPFMT